MNLFEAAKSANIIEVYKNYAPSPYKIRKGRKSTAVTCPFHEDKRPSLNLYPADNSFFCFSQHEHGDNVDLVAGILKIDKVSAAKRICEDFGIEYEDNRRRGATPERAANDQEKQHILEINRVLALAFHGYLQKAPNPSFFKDRGLGLLVDTHMLGYCPTGKLFKKIDMMKACGLGNDAGECVFAGRYIVPLKDMHGIVVGFIGRLPDSEVTDEKPKYLISCNSAAFRKRDMLFNSQCLLEKSDSVLVVEGVFDALSYIAAGVTNVVSPLGNSLTDAHLDALRRFTKKNIVLGFDRDPAGFEATRKALCYAKNLRIGVLSGDYKGHKDANEVLVGEGAPYLASTASSVPGPDYVLSLFEKNNGLDTLEGQEKMWTVFAKMLGSSEMPDVYPLNSAYTPIAIKHYWAKFDKAIAAHPIK